jgi:hypothetical protein
MEIQNELKMLISSILERSNNIIVRNSNRNSNRSVRFSRNSKLLIECLTDVSVRINRTFW